MGTKRAGKRVAVVRGLRTPFAKQGSLFQQVTALYLGKTVVNELVWSSGIDANLVEQVVYGAVVPSLAGPNIAREIVLSTGLPQHIKAYSVSEACITSYQAAVNIADSIGSGAIECGIAGGADSASDVPIAVSKRLSSALVSASKTKSLSGRVRAFSRLKPKDFVPVPPALTELSTGLSMGQGAEKMAKENGISRSDQDDFAHRSHTRAAAAWRDGKFAGEVMSVYPPGSKKEAVTSDNLVRRDSTRDGYDKLRPAFDRKHGTVTAGNSSPLTDGASALLLMREDKAKALGLDVLGFIRSAAFAGLDPREQSLMGPSYATPLALDRAKVSLSDMDLVDMHEAFAAQVLSNTQALESKKFAQEKLGRKKAIGVIDWDKFNVNGGSIALGHPFAATGARQITQTLRELKRRGGGLALCTACAAGGLGAAMVLESE